MLANLFRTVARWLSGPDKPLYEHEALTMGDPFVMTQARIMQIEVRQGELRKLIASAERGHKARSHLHAEMTKLTTERLNLERLWGMG